MENELKKCQAAARKVRDLEDKNDELRKALADNKKELRHAAGQLHEALERLLKLE